MDNELIADINASKGKSVISGANSSTRKEENKKRKKGNLTSIDKEVNSSRMRLEKRLLNPKNLNRIGSILDGIERRLNFEKFHHNFDYALQS